MKKLIILLFGNETYRGLVPGILHEILEQVEIFKHHWKYYET